MRENPTAKDLTTFFVDLARHRNGGDSPPRRTIGIVARELGVLVKENHRADVLYRGIEILVEKGLDPSTLSGCVFSAQSQLQGGSYGDAALLRAFLDAHADDGRWPTGWRQARGQGLHYLEDPLGWDRAPDGYPNNRPTRAELVAALRAKKEAT